MCTRVCLRAWTSSSYVCCYCSSTFVLRLTIERLRIAPVPIYSFLLIIFAIYTHACTTRCAIQHPSAYTHLHKQVCIFPLIHIRTLAQADVHFSTHPHTQLSQASVQFGTHPHKHTCTSGCAFLHCSASACLRPCTHSLVTENVYFCTAAPLLAYVLAHIPCDR